MEYDRTAAETSRETDLARRDQRLEETFFRHYGGAIPENNESQSLMVGGSQSNRTSVVPSAPPKIIQNENTSSVQIPSAPPISQPSTVLPSAPTGSVINNSTTLQIDTNSELPPSYDDCIYTLNLKKT